jgi:predicted nucleic-acid-binding protein
MRAVDTNVLVRLSVGGDPAQVAAAEKFIKAGAWASTAAVIEAVWVLAKVYQFSAMDLCKAIEMLLNNPILVLQDPDAVTEALELFRARPALGFTDCVLLELARKAGHLPFGTFDRKLARVDGAQQIL